MLCVPQLHAAHGRPKSASAPSARARSTAAESAGIAVERIRLATEQRDWSAIAPGLAVAAAAGVATFADGESVEELLGRADAALYRAKNGGRNRWVIGSAPAARGAR